MENDSSSPGPTRRRVVQLGAVAGLGLVGAGTLAACGDGDTADGAAGGAAGGAALAKLADVPVGGAVAAKTADGTQIVIVQPTAGTVTAFDAACTHEGCPVRPNGASLDCNCHGSAFALDGSVTKGPATEPLAPFAVTVDGEDVVTA